MSRSYNFSLGTSDNGNVQAITNCRDTNRAQNFTYDTLNRISSGSTTGSNWGEDFTIDAWGKLDQSQSACRQDCVRTADGQRDRREPAWSGLATILRATW